MTCNIVWRKFSIRRKYIESRWFLRNAVMNLDSNHTCKNNDRLGFRALQFRFYFLPRIRRVDRSGAPPWHNREHGNSKFRSIRKKRCNSASHWKVELEEIELFSNELPKTSVSKWNSLGVQGFRYCRSIEVGNKLQKVCVALDKFTNLSASDSFFCSILAVVLELVKQWNPLHVMSSCHDWL